MYRSDEMGHDEVEVLDELARIDDEVARIDAAMAACEHEDREQDARDEVFFRKFRIVEIFVGVALIVTATLWGNC